MLYFFILTSFAGNSFYFLRTCRQIADVKKLLTFFFFLIVLDNMQAQTNTSCDLRISLLTCSPGEDLYSLWGHSALRITDSAAGVDIIYNYGTFDFDDPAFYTKFTRGNLLYFVSVEKLDDFLQEYIYEKRGVTEQVLNLSCDEKEKLAAALQENAKEENKYYIYDFMYDNCTTRLRDIVFKNAGGSIETGNIREKQNITFRNMIHSYMDKSHQYWSKLGIDILLGEPLDKKVTNNEAMFLPDYLMKGFDNTTIDERPLVSEKKEILKSTMPVSKTPFFSPFIVFALLFLIVTVLTFLNNTEKFLSVFDFFLFFISGLLGIFLLFMWFGTDHPECKDNYNLLWAFPLHIVVVFFIYKKWRWVRFYFLLNSILLLLLLVSWEWLPQEMNSALIPVAALLLLRSFSRYKNPMYVN